MLHRHTRVAPHQSTIVTLHPLTRGQRGSVRQAQVHNLEFGTPVSIPAVPRELDRSEAVSSCATEGHIELRRARVVVWRREVVEAQQLGVNLESQAQTEIEVHTGARRVVEPSCAALRRKQAVPQCRQQADGSCPYPN